MYLWRSDDSEGEILNVLEGLISARCYYTP
jgi:hypothetical protein